MSKDKIQLLSPLFLKYQTDFEKNPRSRVFAPLAETYRKLGMTDKAMEILSQGIRFHPTYVMGYLGLAFCYFDLKQYNLAYSTLRPLVENNRDNIRLQKLFAEVCLELGHKEESLETYKYLLFTSPRDKEVAAQVAMLEKSIEDQYKPIHNPIYIPESEFRSDSKSNSKEERSQQLFDIDKLENRPKSSNADFDDWMALDLSRDNQPKKSEDPYEFWNLKKGDTPVNLSEKTESFSTPVIETKKEIYKEEDLPHVELDFDQDEDENDEENDNSSVTEAPLVTHTLVDLYCGQGHMEKALEVLEKILILNPNDQKTINKIAEIKELMGPYANEVVEKKAAPPKKPRSTPISLAKPHLEDLHDVSEEDGRKNLMSIFDQQVAHVEIVPEVKEVKSQKNAAPSQNKNKNSAIEAKLTQFLKKIQKRALDYQARV